MVTIVLWLARTIPVNFMIALVVISVLLYKPLSEMFLLHASDKVKPPSQQQRLKDAIANIATKWKDRGDVVNEISELVKVFLIIYSKIEKGHRGLSDIQLAKNNILNYSSVLDVAFQDQSWRQEWTGILDLIDSLFYSALALTKERQYHNFVKSDFKLATHAWNSVR